MSFTFENDLFFSPILDQAVVIPGEKVIVSLTDEQKKYSTEEIGRKRHFKKKPEIRDYRQITEGPDSHESGACVEFAYSLITGIDIDTRLFDDHGDDYDFNGVDVKGSSWPKSNIELKVPVYNYEKKKSKVKYYVLARFSKDYKTIEFLGSIDIDRFDKIKYKEFHRQWNWTVLAKDLDKVIPFITKEGAEVRFIKI